LVAEITSEARKASTVPLNAVNEKQRKAGIETYTDEMPAEIGAPSAYVEATGRKFLGMYEAV
jgi:hypothetical protein